MVEGAVWREGLVEYLVLLQIVENRKDGELLSRKKGIHLWTERL